MTSTKEAFGSSGQAITCTITSLATGGARQSAVVDNSSNLYLDALVTATIKSGSASTTSTGTVAIYAYGTVDGGTTYTEGATGSDAGITLTSPTNARLIGLINMVANSTTYTGGPFSVAAAFGGTLPQKWGVIVLNSSGGTFDATTASIEYQGVYLTNA
jgi:hypothetical protein